MAQTTARSVVTASDVTWDSIDGITYGYLTIDEADYEITITESVPRSMWSTGTNIRTWDVCAAADNSQIACSTADGLRYSKRDALAALNAYVFGNEGTG